MDSTSENKGISKIKVNLTKPNTLKNIAGFIIGAVGGFIYYRTIGCTSGGCAITSNPYMSMLWGGVMGYLLADIFKIKDKKTKSPEPDKEA